MKRSISGPVISVGEIEDMLKGRAESLVRDIFPNAIKDGKEMCIGSLAGEKGQSLRVHIGSGSKCGWWKDWQSGQGGDMLILIRDATFGGHMGNAVAWAKGWLSIDDSDPAKIEQRRVEARAHAEERDKARDHEIAQARGRAVKRWHQAAPMQLGDPVHCYLRGRAIDFEAMGRFPGAARYHHKLHYGYGPDARILPAMVWMINNLAGEHIATHRTWLGHGGQDAAGRDIWRKAGEAELGVNADGRRRDAKKVMGNYQGGHIAIWKGAQKCPLKNIAPGTDVYVSEGVEDGLSAACMDPSLRIIAMISLSNLINLELPPQMGRLLILKQNDGAGSEAEKAMQRAVSHHRSVARNVGIILTPAPHKDFNDWLQYEASQKSANGGNNEQS